MSQKFPAQPSYVSSVPLTWSYSYETLLFTKTWPHPAPIQLARRNPWERQNVRDQSVSRMLQRSERLQGEYHRILKPSLPPTLDPTRCVTISLKDDIKKELDKKCHWSEDRKKWIDTMAQQLCLPPQTERKVEAPRERQRPQCSYSDWTSCRSHPRRDPTKSEGC